MKVKISSITIGENRRSVDPEKVQMLADSIKEVGLLSPVVISQDNVLVAGHHRLEAFKLLGRDEIEITLAEPNDKLRLRLAELDENLVRNEGTALDQSEWLAERKEIYEKLYPETTASTGKELAEKRWNANDNLSHASFTDDTAQKTGVTKRTVERKVKRAKDIPQEARDIIRETPSADKGTELDLLAKVAKKEPEKAVELAQKVASGEAKDIKEAVAQDRRKERVEQAQELAESVPTPIEEIQKRYNIIYADPPWRYEHVKTENRAIENHYPTMDLDDICNLPVGDLSAPDCVLFMWTTAPKLYESMKVLDAWGFTYRTSAVWVKDRIGMGYYFRSRHELLLVAAKGSLPVPETFARHDSVIELPKSKHSAKPHEFYDIIEKMYPEYDKIELFARNTRDGWDGWGNQYENAA